MSRFRWATRTSLFARMSLLFGLLVTVPLIISGIVLSLAGRDVVQQSGRDVGEVGRGAVDTATSSFQRATQESLSKAGEQVAAIGEKQLGTALGKTIDASTNEFRKNTAEMRKVGQTSLQTATGEMQKASHDALEESLKGLAARDNASLSKLTGIIVDSMTKGLDLKTTQESLQRTLLQFWEANAQRRADAVRGAERRIVNNVVARLQVPSRTSAVVRLQPQAAAILDRGVRRGFVPEIVRVVLVTATGDEMLRIPETDLDPGTPEPDWAGHPTRTHFLASTDAYITEPIMLDSHGRWVRRVVHQVFVPKQDPDPMDGGPMTPQMGKTQTPFLVVDVDLDFLVDEATPDPLGTGMQVAVIQAGQAPAGGKVVSYKGPKTAATLAPALAQAIMAQLPAGDDAATYVSKPFELKEIKNDGGARLLARAWYWGSDDNLWTVVTQPEENVYADATTFVRSINNSWGGALGAVKNQGEDYIHLDSKQAAARAATLAGNADGRIAAAQRRLRKKINADLADSQAAIVKSLSTQLNKQKDEITASARPQMIAQTQVPADEAERQIIAAADLAKNQAAQEIETKRNQVAKRAAQKMLLNSAWLIPLFLLLALFLATLTAKSLVRPINQLVKATGLLAEGQYHQRIRVRSDDELGRLAVAFNDMAGAIERGQTELQRSYDTIAAEKARIHAMIEASPDGLALLEPDGRVGLMNPTAVALLNLEAAQLPPPPFHPAQLPEPAATHLRESLALAAASEDPREYEFAEPERTIIQVRDVTLRTADGRSYGRLLHLHDVTRERVVDEMKTDFISLVSHELRTPLTSILGFSSYMLTGKLGEVADTQKTALESIHRQAKRLSAIISDFLDISRIESGKIEMKKERVPVPQIAGRVIQDLRPQAGDKNVRVTAHVNEGPLPLVALGDEQRIAQVFTNLLGNALKFTDPNGAIDVSVARQNGELTCSVRDSGCGIPPDELDRVFDRFYQVEKVVTRKTGGTGLGLAIVKNIVEAHGGRIWIESTLGEGTVVSFTLPGTD